MAPNDPLKIMYLSPVGTSETDQFFADLVARYKDPSSEVHVVSLTDEDGGFSHIEYRSYQGAVTRGILRVTREAARDGFDALAIGCFYDTALEEARELSGRMVVVAPCQASIEIASSLSHAFGIVVGRRKWVPQMRATIRGYGHADRLTGFYEAGLGVNDFQKDRERTLGRLLAAGRKAVEEDHAESLILGCTDEAGFYEAMEGELGVPVIDSFLAALKRAEYGARLKRGMGWVPSRKWGSEAPPEEELRRFGGLDGPSAIGNRVVVPANG